MGSTAASGILILPRLPAPDTRSAWRLRPGDIIATVHGPARVITRYAPLCAGRVIVIAETPATPASPGSRLALKRGTNEQVRLLPPASHQTLLAQARRIRSAASRASVLAGQVSARENTAAGLARLRAELEQARAELGRLWQAQVLGVAA